MKMRLILIGALFFTLGATAAVAAAVPWPAACRSDSCVNSHLNDLNKRVKALDATTFSKRTVVIWDDALSEDTPDTVMMVIPCGTSDPNDDRPFKGWAISGGVNFDGANAGQWQIVSSGPPNMMNSWPVLAHTPTTFPVTRCRPSRPSPSVSSEVTRRCVEPS